jgi:hypothetical protein
MIRICSSVVLTVVGIKRKYDICQKNVLEKHDKFLFLLY